MNEEQVNRLAAIAIKSFPNIKDKEYMRGIAKGAIWQKARRNPSTCNDMLIGEARVSIYRELCHHLGENPDILRHSVVPMPQVIDKRESEADIHERQEYIEWLMQDLTEEEKDIISKHYELNGEEFLSSNNTGIFHKLHNALDKMRRKANRQ